MFTFIFGASRPSASDDWAHISHVHGTSQVEAVTSKLGALRSATGASGIACRCNRSGPAKASGAEQKQATYSSQGGSCLDLIWLRNIPVESLYLFGLYSLPRWLPEGPDYESCPSCEYRTTYWPRRTTCSPPPCSICTVTKVCVVCKVVQDKC